MDMAEIPGGHTHWLRHTFITRILHSGATLREAQHIAGHTTISTTERNYAHDEMEYYEIPDGDF
jgi:site-specific recombinase XerD